MMLIPESNDQFFFTALFSNLGLSLDPPHEVDIPQAAAAAGGTRVSLATSMDNLNTSQLDPQEKLPPPVPPQYIVFLDKKDIIIGTVGKSKKQIAEKAIYGLQVHPSKGFDRSIYSCHGGGNFQIGVVYQRELKCGLDGSYKYRAQADYAEYAKDLKYQEFRDIVSALGAQSITLRDDMRGGAQWKGSLGLSAGMGSLDSRGGQGQDTSSSFETNIEFARPFKFQVVTKDTVNLANYEYRDEWKYIVEGRLRPGPIKKIVQNIRFESDVHANLLVSLKVREVGLEVGGDYERTKGYTKCYEVTFFCPDDPEWAPPPLVSPSSVTTSQSSSSTLPISPST